MIVSSKSGGTIEPMSMFKAFHARQGDGSHFAAVTDPGLEPRGARRASTASASVFYGDPDIGGRYSALSPFGLVPAAAAGIDIGAVLDSAIGAAEECRGEQRQRRPVARLRARRARPPGPRQAHLRRRRAADQLRHLGRAAVRRVDRQAGHAASCRSPTSRCSPPSAYGEDRVFLHIALGDADNASQARRAQGRRPPGDHDPRARPDRPRPDLLPVGVRRRRRRLGAGDQPVRPAQRARGQGQHQPGAQGGFPGPRRRAA